MDQLDEEADEPHHTEANAGRDGHFLEFCMIRSSSDSGRESGGSAEDTLAVRLRAPAQKHDRLLSELSQRLDDLNGVQAECVHNQSAKEMKSAPGDTQLHNQ